MERRRSVREVAWVLKCTRGDSHGAAKPARGVRRSAGDSTFLCAQQTREIAIVQKVQSSALAGVGKRTDVWVLKT